MINKLIYFFNEKVIDDFNKIVDFGEITYKTKIVDFVKKEIIENDENVKYDSKINIFGDIIDDVDDYTKNSTNYILKINAIFDDDMNIQKMLNLKNKVKYNEIFLPEKDDSRGLFVHFTKKEYCKDFLKNELNINYDGNHFLINKIIYNKDKTYKIISAKSKKDVYDEVQHNEYTNIEHWKNMPDHGDNFRYKYEQDIELEFVNYTEEEVDKFKSKYDLSNGAIVYPKINEDDRDTFLRLRCLGGRQPNFPIYVVSKGRYDFKDNTSNHLSDMGVYHYIVVEPQEVELYKKYMNLKYCTVLELDMSYKDKYDVFNDELGKGNGTGPGPARNFAIDHSKTLNRNTPWLLVCDDNLDPRGCVIMPYSRRIKCLAPEMFAVSEDFLNRYDNIGLAGYNYTFFKIDSTPNSTFTLNTRIYSFVLMRNDLTPLMYQRGRYNEDTDQSLRILKEGYCTVQFNMFLFSKTGTQHVKKGGNSAEFYNEEGTYNKSKMLEEMHPDVAKCIKKFGRWHHTVNYSVYKQKLHFRNDYVEKEYVDTMFYVKIPSEWRNTEKDCVDYIMEHINECEKVDIKKLYGATYNKKENIFDF